MMNLAQLEQRFQEHILNAGGDMATVVVGTARVPIETRLAIYSDAYRARLEEALQNNYPELAKLLGNEQFHGVAGLYIGRHASAHFSIRWYGDRLSGLLTAAEPYRGRPLLAELAAWEWAMTLAFDAADVPVLDKEMLSTVAPEEWAALKFKPHPSLQLLALHTNAPAVWKALNQDAAPPADAREDTAFPNWIIWRRELDTFFRSLDAAESRALQSAVRAESFATVCEALAEEIGEERAPAQAAQYLACWLQDGLLAA